VDDFSKIVPAVGRMWWPQPVQVQHRRCCFVLVYRLNPRALFDSPGGETAHCPKC
jgi:hypothetical protein